MKAASNALVKLLANGATLPVADCFTFTATGGTAGQGGGSYHYTGLDVPVVIGTTRFAANALRVEGLRYRITRGLSVDEQQVTVAASSADQVSGLGSGTGGGGTSFFEALAQGFFDGGTVTRSRAFFDGQSFPPAPGQDAVAVGAVTLFYGRISTIDALGRTRATLKVKSVPVLMNINMPRNLYSAACQHTLFDTGCGLNAANFRVQGFAGAGSTVRQVNWAGAAAGTFDQGRLTIMTGANAGATRVIAQSDGSALHLTYPLDYAPASGDGFIAYWGCDHTAATCAAKFANLNRFRGFPYVPTPETAY